MKKILLSLLVAGIVSSPVIAAATTSTPVSVSSKIQMPTNTTAPNLLSSITKKSANSFDPPRATSTGVLLRMETTDINTIYGDMQITRDTNGFTITNLSNHLAPTLKVGVINKIYTVGSESDISELVNPILYENGQEIKGAIILPTIDTSVTGYHQEFIEGKDSNGNIVIAPFIYNVVKFKDSIQDPKISSNNSIPVNEVLESGFENLRGYIAHYNKQDKTIIVGVSRGAASVRKEIPISSRVDTSATKTQSTTTIKTSANNSLQSYEQPLYITIALSPYTYILIGILLIILISFLCF